MKLTLVCSITGRVCVTLVSFSLVKLGTWVTAIGYPVPKMGHAANH